MVTRCPHVSRVLDDGSCVPGEVYLRSPRAYIRCASGTTVSMSGTMCIYGHPEPKAAAQRLRHYVPSPYGAPRALPVRALLRRRSGPAGATTRQCLTYPLVADIQVRRAAP
jgi:hypothetical protein